MGLHCPLFIGVVCDPDGFIFHARTQNSNEIPILLILEYLIKAFLGKCIPLNNVYREIHKKNIAFFVYIKPHIPKGNQQCVSGNPQEERCFFRIHQTIHSKGQPQSDPTKYHYTGDVIAMSFKTTNEQKVVKWMRVASSHTPKGIVADAEKSSNVRVIEEKLKAAMKVYHIDREVLGLVLRAIIQCIKGR